MLRISGELDLATSADALLAIERAAAARSRLCLDLAGLRFCDVTGAAALERIEPELRARGCRLTVLGADGALRLLLTADRFLRRLRAATRWGHAPAGSVGKTVWFELDPAAGAVAP